MCVKRIIEPMLMTNAMNELVAAALDEGLQQRYVHYERLDPIPLPHNINIMLLTSSSAPSIILRKTHELHLWTLPFSFGAAACFHTYAANHCLLV